MRTKAEKEQEKAVSEGLDNDFIAECPRCLSTTVFDRYSYIKYLEGRGWDISNYEETMDQIVSFEAHVNAGGVDIRGVGRYDAEGDLYVLCGECVGSFDRRDKAGHIERAGSEWPRK